MAVITHLETDTGTNADISGATAVGAYTANGDKLIMVDVSIDAVAGNGDYVMYVTRQIGGSGSAYRILPQTTMTAASGLTAISGQSGWITVRNGDVLTVYIDGLAGDTSTPDWSTRWFELAGVTAAAVADAVWDEATADHTTGTTFGGKNQKVVPSETVGDYKADVSGLALEATLTAIKGAGWTNETLVALKTAIEAVTGGSGATAQEVWEYATRVLTAGTNLPTANDISDAVWTQNNIYGVDEKGFQLETLYNDLINGGRLDLLVDAIKAKTDNLPADPAAVGSAMTLTAAYDKAKDDVLTPLAVVDSIVDGLKTTLDNIHDTDLPAVKAETALIIEDTGTTIPATLATIAGYTDGIAGDVWTHATRTLTNQGVEATYPAGGDPLTIYRDTTVTISLTGLGDSTGDAGTKIFFTAKENLEDADSDSILQLVCTRANPITDPDTDDLLYVNKVAPTAATEGTFVFTDHTDGTAVVTVAASAAAYLPIYAATPLYWDVKMVTAAGVSTILATGEMYIYGTPTRRVAVVE